MAKTAYNLYIELPNKMRLYECRICASCFEDAEKIFNDFASHFPKWDKALIKNNTFVCELINEIDDEEYYLFNRCSASDFLRGC